MWFRMLGVGLAAIIAAVTVALALTGRLGLYINPDSSWFAVSMAVVALVGVVLSMFLPLGEAADHGHDHGDGHGHVAHGSHGHEGPLRAPRTRGELIGTAATVTGGVLALGVAGAMLVVPPASLSAELAMSRDTGAPPLFQGADTVALAVTGDTASFGIGEWASVFATATDPQAFDGTEISLTGFVAPDDAGFDLTRLVITHCVIDAQPASIPVAAGDIPAGGEWVTVTGIIRDVGGDLRVDAAQVEVIDEPEDPYEF
ncbi:MULTISPECIES: TIGR03943 family putative permease subunit [unclassified Microbacterium]|uniref:TIGR03943 family putative permease subunit n=1 Tax=unclassified Microbacterium TaxID=2609290 RepID=UPI00386C14B4